MGFSRRLLAAVAALFAPAFGFAATQSRAPNVVLITVDTLRADRVGCYGYRQAHTPNMDKLASEGVRFQHAYTPVPITLPAHAVMMTGTYPMLNGMHDFSGNKLSQQQATLALLLKQQGYATGAVMGAAVLDRRFGLDRGFDFYYDHFDFSRLAETNLDLMERPGNQVVDQALKWLGKHSRKPFFLWVHLYDPHHPYRPPSPFAEQYKESAYDGEIAFTDSQIGRLLQYLRTRNLYDNSLIALVADHGEGLGEHGEKTHGFFIYRSTLQIPFILKLPRPKRAAVKVVSEPVNLVQLMPTLLQALGRPVPQQVQGKSLWPVLLGKKKAVPGELYSETFLPRIHFNWSELRGIIHGNYHFIDAPKPELYDLSSDPKEVRNLYAEKPAVSAELQNLLAGVIRKYTPDHELAEKSPLDPELANRLAALGYAAVAGGSSPTISDKKLPDPKDRIQVYETVTAAIDDSQHKRYDESIQKLTAALEIDKDSIPIRYLLGLNYYRQKEFGKSAEQFERVVADRPNYVLAVFNLGLSYASLGQFEKAIPFLNRTLQLDPTNFSAAFDLGVAHLKLNQFEESVAAFRQSVTIYPDFAPGHRALGEMLLFQGNVDEALAQLRTAERLAPNDPRVRLALAKALKAKGLDREAEQEMQRAVALANELKAKGLDQQSEQEMRKAEPKR